MSNSRELILDTIRSKGHWIITFHPSAYDINRFKKNELKEMIMNSFINLSGWEYPIVLRGDIIRNINNGIEVISDLDYYKELWRFTTSGQFYHIRSLREDWLGDVEYNNMWAQGDELKGMKLIGVYRSLFFISTVFIFVKRLAEKYDYASGVHLNIVLNDINKRQLVVDSYNKVPFSFSRESVESSWQWEKNYLSNDIIDSYAKLALEAFLDLIRIFNWDTPPLESLRDEQNKFIEGKL